VKVLLVSFANSFLIAAITGEKQYEVTERISKEAVKKELANDTKRSIEQDRESS
jgi:hypothetical protein